MVRADVQSRRGWVEATAITVAVLVLRLPTMLLDRWYDPDEAAIAMQALAINRGGTLYVDMADRKPPLPPLLYALMFRITGSTDLRPLRLLVGLMLAAAAVVLVREVRVTHGDKAARWAGVLYVLGALALAPVDAGAANYAHFALPLVTVALVACRRPGLRWAAAGGLLLGLTILSRQSWVFALPAGVVSACWAAYRARQPAGSPPGKHRVGPAALAASLPAGAVFAGCCVLGVAACGLLVPLSDFWYWNFASAKGFVFASLSLGALVTRGVAAAGLFLTCHLTLVTASLLGARRSVRSDPDLWVWVATGIAAIAAGFRFYGHYWMQILPPLVLLGAPVMAEFGRRSRIMGAVVLGATGVITWALLFSPNVFRERPSAAPVAAYIREHTAPNDRVFIWGSFPELAVESDRPAAGRLVHSDFVTGRSGGHESAADTLSSAPERPLRMMMSDLLGDPPEIVVDTSGVESLGYSNYPISVIPDLDRFIRANYVVETRLDGLTVLRLKTGS